MTIRQYIKKNGWRNECELVPDYRYMIVHINFLNKNKAEIETSLDIKAFDKHDLSSLFNDFCRENGFPRLPGKWLPTKYRNRCYHCSFSSYNGRITGNRPLKTGKRNPQEVPLFFVYE